MLSTAYIPPANNNRYLKLNHEVRDSDNLEEQLEQTKNEKEVLMTKLQAKEQQKFDKHGHINQIQNLLAELDQRQGQCQQKMREMKEKKTLIASKETTLKNQDVKKQKQVLNDERLKDVRELVKTNREILNEIKESVKYTVQ